MLFSCKISNATLTFLERNGNSLDGLFEQTDLPIEFLRDPSYWINAAEMEQLLKVAEEFYDMTSGAGDLVEHTGHSCWELRSWGVLDSVLKMMDSAAEIYTQPDRFLSYFISPPPPVGLLSRSDGAVAFQIPISTEEYPKTTQFLRAALEGLPKYFSHEPANVEWRETQLNISWSEKQESLFQGQDPGRNMNPIFLQEIVRSLEQSQRELEVKNQELKAAQNALEQNLAGQMADQLAGQLKEKSRLELNVPVAQVMNQVRRLQDYLVRSQQLITLLVGQDRMDSQVQKAMKKVDWEYVKTEYPVVVEDTIRELQQIQNVARDFSVSAVADKIVEANKVSLKQPMNLKSLVRNT